MARSPSGRSRHGLASQPVPATVSASQFKATCLELMEQVARERASVVVTKRGIPIAKLVPVSDSEPLRSRGILRGTILAQGDLVTSDPDDWPDDSEPAPAMDLAKPPGS